MYAAIAVVAIAIIGKIVDYKIAKDQRETEKTLQREALAAESFSKAQDSADGDEERRHERIVTAMNNASYERQVALESGYGSGYGPPAKAAASQSPTHSG